MRYISSQTKRDVRFVGLSTAVANAQDLADWLGIGSKVRQTQLWSRRLLSPAAHQPGRDRMSARLKQHKNDPLYSCGLDALLGRSTFRTCLRNGRLHVRSGNWVTRAC